MKTDFLRFLKEKRIFLTIGLLASSFIAFEVSHYYSKQSNTLSNLKEGLGTCFGRVSQTYTAKMLGEKASNYLGSGFMAQTEECFSEALSILEADFEYSLASTYKLLNTASSDAHWFHEKVNSETSAKFVGSDIQVNNFGPRFRSIEDAKFSILETMGDFKEVLVRRADNSRMAFWLLLGLSLVFLVMDVLGRKQGVLMTEYLEAQAQELNNRYSRLPKDQVEELIENSLENNGLKELNKLIRKVRQEGSEYAVPTNNESSEAPRSRDFVAPTLFETGSEKQNLDEEIKNIWESGTAFSDQPNKVTPNMLSTNFEGFYKEQLDVIHLDNTLARVVNILSGRLFTRGIILEFDIDQELYVYAEEESLEQVFYQILTNAVKDLENKSGYKRIRVGVRSLGGSLIVSFEDNGLSFSDQFMKKESGLIEDGLEDIKASTELEICRTFMTDFGGSIVFENTKNEEGEQTGKAIKLVFKAVHPEVVEVTRAAQSVDAETGESLESVEEEATNGRELTMVKKTTKRELLKQIAAESKDIQEEDYLPQFMD